MSALLVVSITIASLWLLFRVDRAYSPDVEL